MIAALIICGVAFTAMAARPVTEPEPMTSIVLDPDAHMQLERKMLEKDSLGVLNPDAGLALALALVSSQDEEQYWTASTMDHPCSFTIHGHHRAGKRNGNADGRSRAPSETNAVASLRRGRCQGYTPLTSVNTNLCRLMQASAQLLLLPRARMREQGVM